MIAGTAFAAETDVTEYNEYTDTDVYEDIQPEETETYVNNECDNIETELLSEETETVSD